MSIFVNSYDPLIPLHFHSDPFLVLTIVYAYTYTRTRVYCNVICFCEVNKLVILNLASNVISLKMICMWQLRLVSMLRLATESFTKFFFACHWCLFPGVCVRMYCIGGKLQLNFFPLPSLACHHLEKTMGKKACKYVNRWSHMS